MTLHIFFNHVAVGAAAAAGSPAVFFYCTLASGTDVLGKVSGVVGAAIGGAVLGAVLGGSPFIATGAGLGALAGAFIPEGAVYNADSKLEAIGAKLRCSPSILGAR